MGFFASGVCLPMGEAGLDASTGFLEDKVSGCPLLHGAGSCVGTPSADLTSCSADVKTSCLFSNQLENASFES